MVHHLSVHYWYCGLFNSVVGMVSPLRSIVRTDKRIIPYPLEKISTDSTDEMGATSYVGTIFGQRQGHFHCTCSLRIQLLIFPTDIPAYHVFIVMSLERREENIDDWARKKGHISPSSPPPKMAISKTFKKFHYHGLSDRQLETSVRTASNGGPWSQLPVAAVSTTGLKA